MWAWIIIITILFLGSIFIIINLLRKYEKVIDEYQRYINVTEKRENELTARIIYINNEIHSIDKKGSFESDDEVGFFFKELKKLLNLLTEYIEEK